MAEDKKPRALATQAAARISKFVRGNMAATLKAKEERKKVAYTYINDGQDEIIRAMDIVPAYGENFAGICGAKRDAEKYLQKAEADNFSRSICTYATCTIGFDMWREELGGEMPPGTPWGGMGRPDMIIGSAQQLCDPRIKWPQATQHYLQDVPVFVGSMYYPPWDPNVDNKEQEKLYVKYAAAELRELVYFCEKHTGRKMDWDRLASRRPHRSHVGHVHRRLRAAQGYPHPHGYGRRHEHHGAPHLQPRHPGSLRLTTRSFTTS